MLLHIDKSSKESFFEQLVNQIIRLIDSGDLQAGFQLPSSRELAISIGVNRSTVVRAYEELWALGYLDSTPGSYTKVRKRLLSNRKSDEFELKNVFSDEILNSYYNHDLKKIDEFFSIIESDNDSLISFNRLEPDTRLIDTKLINKCYRDTLANHKKKVFGYCHPRGYEPLRHSIVSHMRLHAVNSSDENILITNGSQNSLQLLFQAFISKNDIVAVESPTYSMLISLIKYFGCKILEIPMIEDGMDISVLKGYLNKFPIKMIYTMPTFHNPTSYTMSQAKREELLYLCEKHKIIIVEDSIEEELKYFGKVHLPIKSIDEHGLVIYLGSFSKILASGFRLGWIIADNECIRRLTSLKIMFDLSSNTFSQLMLHQFCNIGYYELHIRKLLRVFKSRMKTAIKELLEPIFLPTKYRGVSLSADI
jgi:DNA-binding transcriptional MocR family regulator